MLLIFFYLCELFQNGKDQMRLVVEVIFNEIMYRANVCFFKGHSETKGIMDLPEYLIVIFRSYEI